MQRMICIPLEQYNQMLESYDNAMRELQEIKEQLQAMEECSCTVRKQATENKR